MSASDIVKKYISFFEEKDHKRIPNAPLVPLNDPTTLFTSSGMQPLVPYLLGEQHPQGKRLVNVQNCFRAQDIDEIGDNRHTTFFRMLGNWSLGDYFKKEQLPWMFQFITEDLSIGPQKLYVSVFDGLGNIPKDNESAEIWKQIFLEYNIDPKGRIHYYSSKKNWWSRSGLPENMPPGEPGGPDTEIFYDFQTPHDPKYGKNCHINCDCGRYFEISNSVFMQYQKQEDGSFKELPKKNVDHGAGLERFLAASEHKSDVFQTSLFKPIIERIELSSQKIYQDEPQPMRIVTDHFVGSIFMISNNVTPSNKEQGYILRRLIRRGLDNFYQLNGKELTPVLESIIEQYKQTDEVLVERFEKIKGTILEEEQKYKTTLEGAKKLIQKELGVHGERIGDELMGPVKISPEIAFKSLATYGLGPTQLKSLGYTFDEQGLAEKLKEHQKLSKKGAQQKFRGGLADHLEQTIMGHTATHLLHQALRDVLGGHVHQTGSNITTERLRFDFNYDQRLTDEQIKRVEDIVNEKIKENLPVHFEIIPTETAHTIGAIGLFHDTYGDKSKIYFIGGDSKNPKESYSIEFCGGPHVDFTGILKRFTIVKQENIGHGQRRIYAVVGK